MAAETLHTPNLARIFPVDITPPSCFNFEMEGDRDRCSAVLTLHRDASVAQLTGYAHGRCRELALLADMASRSDLCEAELRETAGHLTEGLHAVIATLNAIHAKL